METKVKKEVTNKIGDVQFINLTTYDDETLNGVFLKGNEFYGIGIYSYKHDKQYSLQVEGVERAYYDIGGSVEVFDLMRPYIGRGLGKTKGKNLSFLRFGDEKVQDILDKYQYFIENTKEDVNNKIKYRFELTYFDKDFDYPTLDKVYLDDFLRYFRFKTDVILTLKDNTIELDGRWYITTDEIGIDIHEIYNLDKLKEMEGNRGLAFKTILRILEIKGSLKAYSDGGKYLTIESNGVRLGCIITD